MYRKNIIKTINTGSYFESLTEARFGSPLCGIKVCFLVSASVLHFSGDWVFTGWIGFSQWIKREFGDYPQREMLINLGRMSKAEREEHPWFGLYLWERRKGKVDRGFMRRFGGKSDGAA